LPDWEQLRDHIEKKDGSTALNVRDCKIATL